MDPATPQPGHAHGRKPAVPVELSWRKVHDGEGKGLALQPSTATFFVSGDMLPPPKQSRRRCYTAEEKRQVAETRRRGVCVKCKASRIKVNHDPILFLKSATTDHIQCLHGPASPAVAIDQHQLQSQSHEIFALGLTIPSEVGNEDVHKQVMEKTIAAIDNKLAGYHDHSQKAAATRVGSPPKCITFPPIAYHSGPPQSMPNKVHNVAPRHMPMIFKKGIQKPFRVFDLRKEKRQHRDILKPTNGSTPGMEKRSNAIDKKPYSEHLTTWLSDLDRPAIWTKSPVSCQPSQTQATSNHMEAHPARRTLTSSGGSRSPSLMSESMPSLELSSRSLCEPTLRSITPDQDLPEVPAATSLKLLAYDEPLPMHIPDIDSPTLSGFLFSLHDIPPSGKPRSMAGALFDPMDIDD
jgi:hypothetical protein